jgi:hypothetical protein
MFSASVMPGVAYMAPSVTRFIAMEVIERSLAARRQRPTIAIVGVKAIVHMAIETGVTVEPGTRSDEQATDEPVGPVVAVGSAVIGRVVEVAIGADGLDADTDGDLGRPKGCSTEQRNREH